MKKASLKAVLIYMALLSASIHATGQKPRVNILNTYVKISTEEAKDIMFSHSGMPRSKAKITKLLLNRENKVYFYSIEFFTHDRKYSYRINATNGEVMKHENSIRKASKNPPESIKGFWRIFEF